MTMAACVRSNVPVRLSLVAGLMGLVVGMSAAQAPGMVHTGPTLGIGGRGNTGYEVRKDPPKVRVVQGMVLDQAGAPIKGAMVYLKDDKTAQVRSMLVDDKGKFRFMALSFTADYKLWAQAKAKKSNERPISSMDPKEELTRDLKIE
jgi:Carboxypeptidase regulatory-like domain